MQLNIKCIHAVKRTFTHALEHAVEVSSEHAWSCMVISPSHNARGEFKGLVSHSKGTKTFDLTLEVQFSNHQAVAARYRLYCMLVFKLHILNE